MYGGGDKGYKESWWVLSDFTLDFLEVRVEIEGAFIFLPGRFS